MSTSSQVSLGSLRLQAQERSDNENNPAVSTEAWNGFITNSYKELYDMLIAAYGNDYYVAQTYQFNLSNSQIYPLPDGSPSFTNTVGSVAAEFYKVLGVDLQYSASPSGWVTLKNFNFIERNRYAYPNSAVNFNGYTNLRYRVHGNNLMLMPVPMSGQVIQVWYAPTPTNLQYRLPGNQTLGSSVITFTDTTGLSVGMNVTGTGIPDSTTISSIGSTSITISANALSTRTANIISMWSDATIIGGISGWEEYVIVDAALKAQGKQENDGSQLMADKLQLKERIEAMAEARDIGQAFHVSDVLGANAYGSFGNEGGWGMGGWGDY